MNPTLFYAIIIVYLRILHNIQSSTVYTGMSSFHNMHITHTLYYSKDSIDPADNVILTFWLEIYSD